MSHYSIDDGYLPALALGHGPSAWLRRWDMHVQPKNKPSKSGCERVWNYIRPLASECARRNRKWPGCAEFLISLVTRSVSGNSSCPSVFCTTYWEGEIYKGVGRQVENEVQTPPPLQPSNGPFTEALWFARLPFSHYHFLIWVHVAPATLTTPVLGLLRI